MCDYFYLVMFSVVFSCCYFFYRVKKKGPTEDSHYCFNTHFVFLDTAASRNILSGKILVKPQYIPITTMSHSICIAASLSDLH